MLPPAAALQSDNSRVNPTALERQIKREMQEMAHEAHIQTQIITQEGNLLAS